MNEKTRSVVIVIVCIAYSTLVWLGIDFYSSDPIFLHVLTIIVEYVGVFGAGWIAHKNWQKIKRVSD